MNRDRNASRTTPASRHPAMPIRSPVKPTFPFAALILSGIALLVVAPSAGGAASPARTTIVYCEDGVLGISCANSTIPSVIVGSPSGLARPYTMTLRNSNGSPLTDRPAWLGFTDEFCPLAEQLGGIPRPYDVLGFDDGGQTFHCNYESGFPDWVYHEKGMVGGSVTFFPRFGGHGGIGLQVEIPTSPHYVAFGCVEARSTDLDANFVTDQRDKTQILQAIQASSSESYLDLNVDGVVDLSDYVVIVDEMLREGSSLQVVTCPGMRAPPVTTTVALQPDLVAPSAVSDLGTPCVLYNRVTLGWTAPGDDGNLGIAGGYNIRYSTSPITSANFASATMVSGAPLPAPAGTPQQMVVSNLMSCKKYYFAMKATDRFGNTSSISNVVLTKTACKPNVICPLDGRAVEVPGMDFAVGASLSAPWPNPARDLSRIPYAITADQEGQPFELTVFDVAGRRMRTLERGPARVGEFSSEWNLRTDHGEAVRPGLYFIRMRLGTEQFGRTVLVAH